MATTITANGINFPDGSAGSPSIGGTDTNTGLFTGSDIIGFSTGGSERLKIDASGNVILGSDNVKLQIGASQDLYLWHNGSTGNSNISNVTGDLYIQGNNGSGTAQNQIAIKSNAAVELNYQGSKKFETTSDGVTVTGKTTITDDLSGGDNVVLRLGNATGGDLSIYHNGTHSYLSNGTGNLFVEIPESQKFQVQHGSEAIINGYADGRVELYYDNSKKFETVSSGTKWTGDLNCDDNNTIKIGDSQDLQIYHDGSKSHLKNSTGAIEYSSADHKFFNAANNSEYARIDANGIKFNGDSAAANALDDYEEGTWSPAIDKNASSMSGVSYTDTSGTYTKVGRLVTVWFDITVTGGGTSGSGTPYITQLPFVALYGSGSGNQNGGYGAPQFRDMTLTHGDMRTYGNSSYIANSQIYLQHFNSSASTVASSLNGSGRITGQATYFAT